MNPGITDEHLDQARCYLTHLQHISSGVLKEPRVIDLAMTLTRRYLERRRLVGHTTLLHLCLAAYWIAAKYEDDEVSMTATYLVGACRLYRRPCTCTVRTFHVMEIKVLQALEYRLCPAPGADTGSRSEPLPPETGA